MLMKSYFADIIVSGFFLILGSIVLVQCPSIPDPGSRVFPQSLAIIVLILAAIVLFNALRDKKHGKFTNINFSGHKRVLVISAFIVAYIFASDIIGFYFLTPFYLFITMWYMGMRQKKVLILAPIIMTIFLYFIFASIFQLEVPPGRFININHMIQLF